ncbi:aspartate/glutamate racemase family protein [Nonomuraea insulae]|uniref:Aspartate/glutamate racemase family protein n=1 Tax=Nonomuraea insulae TaxID=1616787 RepID=A0ABW1CHB3_9ACTN
MSVLGVVRVITSDDPAFVGAHGRWIEQRYGLRTRSACIPGQQYGVHDDESFARAVPKIVKVAEELAAEGASCVLISCAADPALAETRAAVPIPVVGAGSSGAATALALGGRVGVLGLNDEAPEAVRAVLGDRLAASLRPEGVRRTTDLLEPGAADRSVAAARRLVEAGAEAVLFACTGLTTIGLAPRITKELGVPAVDAVLAAGLMASYAMHDKERAVNI